jgi:hypothetical protein
MCVAWWDGTSTCGQRDVMTLPRGVESADVRSVNHQRTRRVVCRKQIVTGVAPLVHAPELVDEQVVADIAEVLLRCQVMGADGANGAAVAVPLSRGTVAAAPIRPRKLRRVLRTDRSDTGMAALSLLGDGVIAPLRPSTPGGSDADRRGVVRRDD